MCPTRRPIHSLRHRRRQSRRRARRTRTDGRGAGVQRCDQHLDQQKDMPAARYRMSGRGHWREDLCRPEGLPASTGRARRSSSMIPRPIPGPRSETCRQRRRWRRGCHRGQTLRGHVQSGWEAIPDFFRYDPTTDSWTKLPNPTNYPHARSGYGGVINNKLYLIGSDRQSNQSRVLEYDPITNKWTTKQTWPGPSCLPYSVGGPTVVMLSRVYVFGREWRYGGWRDSRHLHL